jgi:hypothetical protein
VANILTAAEAAIVLRCSSTDTNMLQLLPLVDAYIANATGRDWTSDTPVPPEAKSAARMLITMWMENPAQQSYPMSALPQGLAAALAQLEIKALLLEDEEEEE